ncbi:putative ankyrin [Planoprotostelium fungivorum]|uniref:Putative ankyrin n=1 Tax=Planoprotostelium fungivorum TaxID=1890364 RepID=A0A2P6NGV4_9EUKA|nr:putative ankyrin [Planoprotostelium fungivorum]
MLRAIDSIDVLRRLFAVFRLTCKLWKDIVDSHYHRSHTWSSRRCRTTLVRPTCGSISTRQQGYHIFSPGGSQWDCKAALVDPRVDPSALNNHAIRIAASRGHTEIVGLLLSHPRVDPSAASNEAFIYAAHEGHSGTVQLLLSYSRVDPSARDNDAIREAALCRGHTEMIRLLLSNPRVDSSAHEYRSIVLASIGGHAEIIRLLLSDSRMDLVAHDDATIRCAIDEAIMIAAREGQDPSSEDNDTIREAARRGQTETVWRGPISSRQQSCLRGGIEGTLSSGAPFDSSSGGSISRICRQACARGCRQACARGCRQACARGCIHKYGYYRPMSEWIHPETTSSSNQHQEVTPTSSSYRSLPMIANAAE